MPEQPKGGEAKPKPLVSLQQLMSARPELRRVDRKVGGLLRIRGAAVLLLAALFACGPGPEPTPTPPQPTPTPTPTPDEEPTPAPGCRSCSNVSALSRAGVVEVRNPVAGEYLVEYPVRQVRAVTTIRGLAARAGAENVTLMANGFSGELSPEDAAALAAEGYLVQEVQVYDVGPFELAPQAAASWGLARATHRGRNAPVEFEPAPGADGSNILCIVIDTGEPPHSRGEFGDRLLPGLDFTGEGRFDGHGHSSHVTGTFAGATFGIARQCQVRNLKALRNSGTGTTVWVVNAVNAAYEMCSSAPGVRCVVNLSLGAGVDPAFERALCRLQQVAVVVGAAGNDYGRDTCTTTPGGVHEVVSAGATTRADARAPFSNAGPGVQVWGPGVEIVSIGGPMSGTSMTAPHVSGSAAGIWSLHPEWTAAQVRAELYRVATRIGLGRLVYIGQEISP